MTNQSSSSPVGFIRKESTRGENINKGHDPGQFAGHIFCHRTLRGDCRQMSEVEPGIQPVERRRWSEVVLGC